MGDDVRRHAGARIADAEADVLPRIYVAGPGRISIVQMRVAGFDRELAAFRHGVARVDGQVQRHSTHADGSAVHAFDRSPKSLEWQSTPEPAAGILNNLFQDDDGGWLQGSRGGACRPETAKTGA